MSYVTDSPSLVFVRDDGSQVRISCEVANTPATRRRGLMHRAALSPNAGMLFVWPAPEQISMWMENTPLALDIVFLDADWRVLHIARGKPMSRVSIPCLRPAQFVLEASAGWCATHGLRPGASAMPIRIPAAMS
jgi:hypothetical protein